MNKSSSISSASLSQKNTKIEKPKEIDISKDNSSLPDMSGHREILSSVKTDKQHIPSKHKKKKTSDIPIKGNKLFKHQTTQVKGKKRIVYLM